MPTFKRADVSIYYEEYGRGYPILLFAPGGMRSSIEYWANGPFDPTREFAGNLRVIAMDQRNAGQSEGPISADDGWDTYTGDHIALLDHLGIEQCHVMGGCIGSSYCLGMIKIAPRRISAAILQNPIGLSQRNREMFFAMFHGWAQALKAQRPKLDDSALVQFRDRMYGGDFVFNVSREFVRSCKTPMLILCGNDDYHPAETSKEIAALAPNSELIDNWKSPEVIGATVKRAREFLISHTPKS